MGGKRQDHEYNAEQENIITLFQKGVKLIDRKLNRDIVLLLGNTGSGKSTLAQYIIGHLNHLTSVKAGIDYVIRDDKGKVSSRSTVLSKTLYPELIEDPETHVNYYDCPGFSDTRSAAYEITATYFTKKIIDSARSVKLVFTVNHSSMREGNDRKDFMELLQHATNLIKIIKKFKNSIVLVVTKVEKLAETDKEIIASIAKFIENVKIDLEQNSFPSFGENFRTDAIEFIDAILINNEGNFQKIGIFKRPKTIGRLSSIQSYRSERDSLNKILKENIQYTKVSKDDFGFTVSDKTKIYISEWVDEIYKDIISELAKVEKQIIEYFKYREQLYSLKLTEVKSIFNEANDLFSQIQKNTTSQELIEKLIQIIQNLKINTVLKSLSLIHSHENFLSFLNFFSKQSHIKNGLSYLENGLSNVTKYLDDSNKWYTFLYSFYSHLSDYNIQKDISKYNIMAIEEKINQQNKNIKFKDIQSLIQDIIDNCKIKIELLDVRDVFLNKNKVKALINVLKFSLGHKVRSVCSENILTVQGQYIKLSDIDKFIKNCGMKIQMIEIHSLYKIFIDTNLNKEGEKLGIIIISPIWDIINDSEIILDGTTSGQNISRFNDEYTNQTDSNGNGLNGRSGKSGGPAGVFFGVGKTFLNLDKKDFSISAVGGRGENGGNGGNGKDGEDGIGPAGKDSPETFFFANAFEDWNRKKFGIEFNGPSKPHIRSGIGVGEIYLEVDYTIYGRNGTPGGNGGNAGVGGVGGQGGKITVIGLNGNFDIKTRTENGKNGENGKSGRGGFGGKNSELMKVSCLQGSNGKCKIKERRPYGSSASSGKSGIEAKNIIREMNSFQTVTFEKKYPLSINKFKNYLRYNLKNSLNGTFLRDFFDELEKNDQVINCYDAVSLTDELQGLESQYYMLNKEIPLVPFYQSLLGRISSYAKKIHLEGNSKVLWYLYATILSKLSSIKNSFDTKLVVDMKAYLESIENNIKELKESNHQVKIDNLFNNYKQLLDNKTKDFNQFIEIQIKPDIEDIFQEIMSNLQIILIEEINALETKVSMEKDQLSYKQKQMEQLFAKRKVIDALKIVSYFLIALSGVGSTAIVAIETAIAVSSLFVSEEVSLSSVSVTEMPDGMREISNMILKRKKVLFEQLGNVKKELINFQNEYSSETLKDTQEEIKYQMETLEKNMKDNETPEGIEKLKEEAKKMLESEIEKVKMENNTSMTNKKKLTTLKRIKNLLIIDPDLLDTFKESQSKIEVLGKAISRADSTLRDIRSYHEAIYDIIIPKFVDLKSKLQMVLKAMKEKSQFPIEVSKWNIKKTISNFFTYIYKMTKGFGVEEKIMSCIKKLQEAMMDITDIYKNIENYQSETQLHNYLKLINSKKSLHTERNNADLSNAIDKLDAMVQSNLVLSQYQKAIGMFKQYIFPFAHFYLSEFNLPTELQPERNIDGLVSLAVKNLENLKIKILESNLSIGSFDKYINTDIPFSSDNNKSPFFIWSYEKHKDAISKLLEGKEIFLEADITKIRNMNAVKFNVIGLKFKASDENIQSDLDKILEDFNVTLIHLGSSNYRCGDKIYIIKHDKVSFRFSLEMINGVPVKRNKVYDKIKNNDFMISPYTMWNITLNSGKSSFHKLKQFEEYEISLELQGIGQFVGEEINKSVCVDNMDNYYTVNEILSAIDTVEETYLNNTLTGRENQLINHFDNLDNKRKRRHLKNFHLSTEKNKPIATSRGSSFLGGSFINNILKFSSTGFESFRNLNPFTYINSWFQLSEYEEYNPLKKLSSKTTSETFMVRDEIDMSFHNNLVLWDFFLKRYIGVRHNCKSIFSCSNKNDLLKQKERVSNYASSLAYNYYYNRYNIN